MPGDPPRASLVVGVGARRGVGAAEVLALLDAALAKAGLVRADVAEFATVDGRAGEPGLRAAARALGVELVGHPASTLAAVPVPHPSDAVLDATGTPSVAEAAALLAAPGGTLLVPKLKSALATVAIARRPKPPLES